MPQSIDLPAIARRHNPPLAANGLSADCPGGRIVVFSENELAYTGTPQPRLPPGCQTVYRGKEGLTFTFPPIKLPSVLRSLVEAAA